MRTYTVPPGGQALVSTINNNKQENNIKQPKGWQAVFDFFMKKKVLMLMKQKNSLSITKVEVGKQAMERQFEIGEP